MWTRATRVEPEFNPGSRCSADMPLVSQTTVLAATKNSAATSTRFRERKPAPESSVISVISVVPDVTVAGLHGMSRVTLHVAKYLTVASMHVNQLSVQHPSLFLRSRNDWWQNALHVEFLATQLGSTVV